MQTLVVKAAIVLHLHSNINFLFVEGTYQPTQPSHGLTPGTEQIFIGSPQEEKVYLRSFAAKQQISTI